MALLHRVRSGWVVRFNPFAAPNPSICSLTMLLTILDVAQPQRTAGFLALRQETLCKIFVVRCRESAQSATLCLLVLLPLL